jgi:PAS domain S-box-containing protein
VVESSEDALVGKTLEGVVISWNRGEERLFGYSASEMIGQPISKLIPPTAADDVTKILAQIRQGNRVDHYETIRQTKSGRQITVSITVSPIRNAAGEIIGASKIARDITEPKKMREALRESEERLRLAIDAASIGTWSADVTTGEGIWSERCKALFGLQPDAPSPNRDGFLQMLHPDDRQRVQGTTEARRHGSDYQVEYRTIWPDDSTHWIDMRARAYADPEGRSTRLERV